MGNVNVNQYERLDPRTGRKITVSGYSRFGNAAAEETTQPRQPKAGLHPQSSSHQTPADTPKSAGSKLPSVDELRKMPLPTLDEIRSHLEVIANTRNAAKRKQLAKELSSKLGQFTQQHKQASKATRKQQFESMDSINYRLNGFVEAYREAFSEVMESYNEGWQKKLERSPRATWTELSNLQPIIAPPPQKSFSVSNVTVGKNVKFINTKIGSNDLDFPGTKFLDDLITEPHFVIPLTEGRYMCVKTYLHSEGSLNIKTGRYIPNHEPAVASAIVDITDSNKRINFEDFKNKSTHSIPGFMKEIWGIEQSQYFKRRKGRPSSGDFNKFNTPGGKLHSVCLLNQAEATYLFPKLIGLGDAYDE